MADMERAARDGSGFKNDRLRMHIVRNTPVHIRDMAATAARSRWTRISPPNTTPEWLRFRGRKYRRRFMDASFAQIVRVHGELDCRRDVSRCASANVRSVERVVKDDVERS